MRLRDALLTICLSAVAACDKLPPFPEIWQCAYKPGLGYFVCVNTKSKDIRHLGLLDASMEGAQCVSSDDFKSSQSWVETVKQIAQRRCK